MDGYRGGKFAAGVVDAAADVGGQGGEQVIVFCRGLSDVGPVSSFDAILDFSQRSVA